MRHIDFVTQAAHFMNLPKLHQSVNRTPVKDYMKRYHKNWAICFALIAIVQLISLSKASAQIQVGSGDVSSFLVIEAVEFGAPLVFQWNYTYVPSNPFTTADMLVAVDLASIELDLTILYGGTFLDAMTYNSITLTNEFAPPYSPFWAQWVSGGTSGSPLVAKPSGVWNTGYGITSRELEPGSWDGFIFNGAYDSNPPYDVISAAPTTAPVPESSSLILLALSISLFVYVRKSIYSR